MGDIKDAYYDTTHFVQSVAGYGDKSTKTKKKKEKAAKEAEAAYKQALFEAASREGLDRLAMTRRRGFGSSIIVDPGQSLGAGSNVLG